MSRTSKRVKKSIPARIAFRVSGAATSVARSVDHSMAAPETGLKSHYFKTKKAFKTL